MDRTDLKVIEDILKQEFNSDFVKKMEQHCTLGYFKRGPMRVNAGEHLTDMMKNLRMNLDKYDETGNTEYLVSVALYSMFEFTIPQHPKAHYKATDSDESAGYSGMSFRDIENL
jgi:hypothetical protein